MNDDARPALRAHPNGIVSRALQAVTEVSDLASRLAAQPVTEETVNVAVEADNSAFGAALLTATTAVQAAMDEVDGQALTAFDNTLDALDKARSAFQRAGDNNRQQAAAFAQTAREHAESAARRR